MNWTAGFRSAVISPYEQLKLAEPRGFAGQTVRQVLHMAGGGERLRVRLTNRYGRAPLTIAAARAATEHGQAGLTFGGADKTVIPPGEEAVSDPVELSVAPGADLTLSLYLPEETGLATYSHMPMETAHVAAGDHVASPELPGAEPVDARFYVSGVDVPAPGGTGIAVAFGDSWFEGVGSTVGANNRSVDFLNRRLGRGWVVNQGIAGNRLLRDEIGEHALGRFDRDVLSVPGVTHVLVHFGINDLGLPGMSGEPPATAGDLVEGFRTLAGRAHGAGLKILVATIGPFAGAIYPGVGTPEGLAVRREVNDWIRAADDFDAVFDVAGAVEDPEAPDRVHPGLDAGDGMHLNDRGAQAMADAVDLKTLAL
ncbi:GDSL-type esterase/lipase family protein [Spongiactinospora sp. TRM90649]|uniref:GDSL-type esterase/lipase family protein n=1 Tax=Spongiactinospora sp. TRM90649 TaxID=3031114 RepID=UPI0023FA04E9|nr:GDSL-type esterase/lipase family protein [Spongiactinospora sp. TRM90649]MDF5754376.1 GDSL-type esterase/lipase family protein [Spongiactinospora sp. TRM90649]